MTKAEEILLKDLGLKGVLDSYGILSNVLSCMQDYAEEYHQEQLKESKLKIGEFEITKDQAISQANQNDVMYIKREDGEGISIDLHRLWKSI